MKNDVHREMLPVRQKRRSKERRIDKKFIIFAQNPRSLQKLGYISLFFLLAVGWGIVLLSGILKVWPWGIIGFLLWIGIVLLFTQVMKEKTEKKGKRNKMGRNPGHGGKSGRM